MNTSVCNGSKADARRLAAGMGGRRTLAAPARLTAFGDLQTVGFAVTEGGLRTSSGVLERRLSGNPSHSRLATPLQTSSSIVHAWL